ncbi:hypothetical protein GO004_21710 [Bacillus subtilis]|nr:hypothetical protein [Bacillus subtilis]QPD81917.1 hypothetical protein GO005_13645 [Bacillus subtilis]QPF47016.1 hypothetical protein GO004_21710 [Bacillus subtilis]
MTKLTMLPRLELVLPELVPLSLYFFIVAFAGTLLIVVVAPAFIRYTLVSGPRPSITL